MKSQTSLNLGYLGSSTRSVCHIKEIHSGQSKCHISCSIDMKISQNICHDETWDQLEFGPPGVIN